MREEILAVAKKAARAAGTVQKQYYGRSLNVDAKLKNDIKLEADRLCEAEIVRVVGETFPGHAVLAEEGGARAGDPGAEYRWIIDPLDGTVNFYYGLPYFCTSVACYRSAPAGGEDYSDAAQMLPGLGVPVAAAVYSPATEDFFSASLGGGAFLNDVPVRAAAETELSECMIATGFGSTEAGLDRMLRGSGALCRHVRKLRCLGAAAFDICNVACGRLSGFFEKGLHHWDVAAASLIAREAGAVVRAREFMPGRWDYVVSAPGVAEALREVLERSARHGTQQEQN